ncbi:hypothetical protein MGYG_08586 [Nannizzia gypsea CBS 118893]|uniref:Uncharacterized protein n=1 Tax=Arthroderma gypseum (strain ATCC MYA-4604 / CBS 118893) TaxID=535722 RepID=E4V6E7_ARTGP|nr:hypothetical protein MGYG_08586 [Nannizzia gypsea CBS 118893]EFQ96663.1 hypothetical protein MGYG_08586 [Nannizzia gypsea CBS 118893]
MALTVAHRRWLVAATCLIGAYFLAAYLNHPESRYSWNRIISYWQPPSMRLDDEAGWVACTLGERGHYVDYPYYRLAFIRDGLALEARPSMKAGGDYIGLQRFEEIAVEQEPADEDEFARKIRLIGAIWRPPDNKYGCSCYEDCEYGYGITEPGDDDGVGRKWLAWPSSGGLWAFEATERECWISDDVRRFSGMWRVAITMDEAAQLLKNMSRAVFYENPADYPPFADLFDSHGTHTTHGDCNGGSSGSEDTQHTIRPKDHAQ